MMFRTQRFGHPGSPRILWLHGFLGSGAEGRELFAPWLDGHEILCPDLPGHGDPPTPAMPLAETLACISALARGTRLAAGYSLGGRLLMMAAARNPGAFPPLVLESTFPGYSHPRARDERRRVDAERAARLRREGVERFCAWWYAQPMWAGLDPPQRTGDAGALATALETFGSGHMPDMRPWLKRTTSPVLWLAGERDSAYVEISRWVARHAAPRVRVEIVRGAGHNIHREQPAAWRAAVNTFPPQPHAKEQ